VAAVAASLALARLFIRGANEEPSELLHGEIEMDKGKKEEAHVVADPSRDPLARDATFG